jgi:hypothetical protein
MPKCTHKSMNQEDLHQASHHFGPLRRRISSAHVFQAAKLGGGGIMIWVKNSDRRSRTFSDLGRSFGNNSSDRVRVPLTCLRFNTPLNVNLSREGTPE